MALEDDEAIREQMVCRGADTEEIDDIRHNIGISYAQNTRARGVY